MARSNRSRTGAIAASLLVAAFALLAPPVAAHPLGNFSISHYSGLHIDERAVELHYVLDLAEIPTFQEIQDTGIVPDADHPSVAGYARSKAEALKEGLRAEVGGRRLAFETQASQVIFPPGAGGLPTLKIGIRYRAAMPNGGATVTLSYRDTNYGDRAGWKEIVATRGQGILFIESSVPEADRSRQLAEYPADLLNNPPQDTETRITFRQERLVIAEAGAPSRPLPPPAAASTTALASDLDAQPGTPTLARESSQPSTPRDRFTELITATPTGPHLILIALLIAMGLGAFHALEPGHGKTMVAAYLVGSRGTAGHAVLLGLIVTAAHTAGVYLLGAVTLYASRYFVPERIYPWLGVASGLTIAALGVSLFLRRYLGAHDHHSRTHNGVEHAHRHVHEHVHDHSHAHHHPHGDVTLKELFTLGVTGGIIPCPAALVVLLSALSLGRVGFGLVLIVAFSLGLAAVLIVTGLLMVYARRLMTRVQGDGALIGRWLPLTSSAVITIVGLAIVIQAGAAWTRP
jgi:ABC-type nickel/cobalt efflux system permease component RcnA